MWENILAVKLKFLPPKLKTEPRGDKGKLQLKAPLIDVSVSKLIQEY